MPTVSGFDLSVGRSNSTKKGEYGYLTMAIISSGPLLIKRYFLSSDGAPEFGPDAMQIRRSSKYTPPEVKEEKET